MLCITEENYKKYVYCYYDSCISLEYILFAIPVLVYLIILSLVIVFSA